MSIPTLYATLTSGLLLFLLCPTQRLSPTARALLLLAAIPLVTVPIGNVSITVAVRAAVGDLSIFTFCWLACSAAERIRPGCTPLTRGNQRLFAAGIILAAGAFLYPAGMGLIQWDPYRLGYQLSLVGASLAVVLAAYYLRQVFTLLTVSLCLAAYALQLLESTNLWDYLIDPAITVYALVLVLRRALRRG
jgi:hypothetical protein